MADDGPGRLRCYAAGIDAADGAATALQALEDYDRHLREPKGFRHDVPKVLNSDRTLYWSGVTRVAQAADVAAECGTDRTELQWVEAWRANRGRLQAINEQSETDRKESYYLLVNLLLRMRETADRVLPFRPSF